LASLNHPNIATIYDLPRRWWRAFSGARIAETLVDRVARGPIPLDDDFQIAKSICEALEAAHERGLIHGDLKPAKIKLTWDRKCSS